MNKSMIKRTNDEYGIKLNGIIIKSYIFGFCLIKKNVIKKTKQLELVAKALG